MAKKKSTKKKESKQPKPKANPSDPKSEIKKIAKTWKEWKELKTWAKNSKKPVVEWKKKIIDRSILVAEKIKDQHPDYFKMNIEKDSTKFYEEILKNIKRRVHNVDYIKMVRPTGVGVKAEKYKIFIMYFSRYFDWGNRKYNSTLEEYTKSSPAVQETMETDGTIEIKRDKATNKMQETVPMMDWGKNKIAIPKHSWMGNAIGVAMPSEVYEKAVEEGDDSKLWNQLMPCTIDLNSNTQRSIHYADPKSDVYIMPEEGKCYEGDFYCKRGPKITIKDGEKDKTIYLYEGRVTKEEITDENDEKQTIVTYEGQRSYQYDLAPSAKPNVVEIPFEQFNIDGSADYFINDVAYLTWSDLLTEGMMEIPDFFREYHTERKGRENALHPIAFECDVLEAFVSKPTDEQKEDPNWKPFRRLRLDDQLEAKEIYDGETEFLEITLGCNNLSEELIDKFDDIAQNSRIRVIANLTRITSNDNIGGECLWYDIITSTAIDVSILGEEIFNTEESDEEINIEEKEIENKSDEDLDEGFEKENEEEVFE